MRQFILVLVLAVGLSSARWMRRSRSNQPREISFVGKATNALSTAIFQGYIDDDKNIAFSPLGYSAILAILAEGAKGETRQQLVSALHLPEDQQLTRKTFRSIMERLKNTNEYKYNTPELKNFFYIYKNYTINDDYKKILEDYYLTEVRSVERYNPDHYYNREELKDTQEFTVDIPEKKQEDNKNEEIPELLPPAKSDEKFISFAVDDKPDKVDVSQIEYKPAKNIKEKIKLVKSFPKKEESGEDEETMVAVEARNHARSLKVLEDKNDITSSISVNSVGKKSSTTSHTNSLMIIFNGMYFRGSWKHPFDSVENGVFYKSSTEKKQVPMMKARGAYRTGFLPGLDSEAIQLPYDGGRYALLVVAPRSRDGLTRLTADLPASTMAEIQDSLREEELQVCLPTFYVETTTKPVAALAKFGVSSIFSRDAELSGVSSDEGLFVQELVQHVAVRVDNADASASELSAANPSIEALKNLPLEQLKPVRKFIVDHPFMFFIIDCLDNLVVVSGKVVDPEQPTPFEILSTLCIVTVRSQNILPYTNPYPYGQIVNQDQIYFMDEPNRALPLSIENKNNNQENSIYRKEGISTQALNINSNAEKMPRPSVNLEPPVYGRLQNNYEDRFLDRSGANDKEAEINKQFPPAIIAGPLSRPVTKFGLELMKGIIQPGQNQVLSPFSVSSLLALLQQGAMGATRQQITAALQMSSEAAASIYKNVTQDVKSRKSNNLLKLATNIFIADAFQVNPTFKSIALNSFNSELTPMRFVVPERAAQMINNWVADKTSNKIIKLVSSDSIDENTQLMLVNAVYFKGAWDLKFNPDVTQLGTFHLSDRSQQKVPFMRMRRFLRTGIDRSNTAQIVVLPFEKEEYSLMVILPSQISSIAEVLPTLTDSKLLEYHQFPYEETALELPKFTVRSDTDLNIALRKLGVQNMFSNNAELSGVGTYRSYSPQVSSALHSAMLSIDEQGGSAAAATAFAVVALSYDEPTVSFRANRPFISILWDSSSGVPLFMAAVEKPAS
ncbi:uncharacterized protein LOC128678492 [Plodia interpunctella]|uniref:uncharacterized protein LOC128678492 n=1 Tax=Plodia interpunctella TaxID=58824 RepID=UPI003101732C